MGAVVIFELFNAEVIARHLLKVACDAGMVC